MNPEELEAIRLRNAAPISCDRCGQTATHQRDDLDVVRLLCADHADADDDELTEHQTPERADIAALLSELDRITSELAAANDAFTELAENMRLATGTIESAKEALAAAHAERDRLRTVAESRLMRMRSAAQVLVAEIGAKGPENVDITAGRAVAVIEALKAELATARRGPVVEWRTRIDVEEATVGAFALLVESDGWRLEVSDGTGDYWIVDSGTQTGPAGKAAAEAAYLKAAGLA